MLSYTQIIKKCNYRLNVVVVVVKTENYVSLKCGVWGVCTAALPHRILLLGFSSPTGSPFEFDDLLKLIQKKPMDLDLRRECSSSSYTKQAAAAAAAAAKAAAADTNKKASTIHRDCPPAALLLRTGVWC